MKPRRILSGSMTVSQQPIKKIRKISQKMSNILQPPNDNCINELSCHSEVSNTWNELREKKQLCDGLIRTTDGCIFHIHRAILSVASPYFKALFTNSLRQGNPETTEVLFDIDSDLLNLILDFVYTGRCKVNKHNIERLLPVADQLQVLGVVKFCCNFLYKELRPDNCLGIYKFAKHYFCKELEKKSRKFILVNFSDLVSQSNELKQLSVEELEDLLRDDELNARNEEHVFEALVKWTECESETRVDKLTILIHCVRYGLMSYKYFTDVVLKHPLVAKNQACQASLFEASIFLSEMDSSGGIVDLHDPVVRPRIPHEILFAVGGWSAGSPTSFVETYDTRADRWFLSVNTDVTPRAYHGLVELNGLLYIIGGFDGNEHFNTVRCFDPVTKTWHERACMYTPRCYVSVCTLDGMIYALGGYDGRVRMNSAEKYDPKINQWKLIPPMHRHRSDASAASLGGKIYIAGGFNGQEVLNSAETYDPRTLQWSFISPMLNARSGVNLVAYQGYLYALGGFNGFARLSSGEKYDPCRGFQWQEIPEMYSRRSNFATAILDDMIFVIGGFNGATTISLVECYDGESNEWFDASNMNLNRSALSACVVRNIPNIRDYSYIAKLQEVQGYPEEEKTTTYKGSNS